jgi:hypothetical protein
MQRPGPVHAYALSLSSALFLVYIFFQYILTPLVGTRTRLPNISIRIVNEPIELGRVLYVRARLIYTVQSSSLGIQNFLISQPFECKERTLN